MFFNISHNSLLLDKSILSTFNSEQVYSFMNTFLTKFNICFWSEVIYFILSLCSHFPGKTDDFNKMSEVFTESFVKK